MKELQYATKFDINMGYYTIGRLPDSQDMTTIVTEFGKFEYNCLPMAVCSLVDISQSKVDKVIGNI